MGFRKEYGRNDLYQDWRARLDEATSALDVTTERKVLRNIIKQRPNKTCIVTTHRPSVLNMCQRVYRVMETQVTELSEEESSKMAMDF